MLVSGLKIKSQVDRTRAALENHVKECSRCQAMVNAALCGAGTIMLDNYVSALRTKV